MNDGRLSEIKQHISNQIFEIQEELKSAQDKVSDPHVKNFINSVQQSYHVLLELDEKIITPKLTQDMKKLAQVIERLNSQVKPDQSLLRAVLAAFEALQEDLKIVKKDPEELKRGQRAEKVDNERME